MLILIKQLTKVYQQHPLVCVIQECVDCAIDTTKSKFEAETLMKIRIQCQKRIFIDDVYI